MRQPTPEIEQRFSDWQRGLTLPNKQNQTAADVAARQGELIEAVNGGSAVFAAYLRTALGLEESADLDAPPLPRMIDPSEFRDPPFQLEWDVFSGWADRWHPRDASQPLLWTRCHVQWIGEGQFGERLAEAFLGKLSTGAEEEKTEAAARNLLRRLGGLPHVRGKVSVLNDCPLSRAWWRGRIASDAADWSRGAFDAQTAHRVLHSNNDAWARLVGDSVRRITVVNQASVRAALIYQYRGARRDDAAVPAQELQTAVRLLARHGPGLVFDGLDWEELCELTEVAVADARAQLALAAEAQEPEPAGEANPPARRDRRLRRFLRR